VKRVFVCSAYRGDIAANVEIARSACREVLRTGDAPFAPHLLYPDLLDDDEPAERALGIEAGRRWLAMAHEVLVVGPVTAGMREEIATAVALGIPVRYATPTTKPPVGERGGVLACLRGVLPTAWEDRAALAGIVLVVLGFFLCPGR
jgi:hypothetical protein